MSLTAALASAPCPAARPVAGRIRAQVRNRAGRRRTVAGSIPRNSEERQRSLEDRSPARSTGAPVKLTTPWATATPNPRATPTFRGALEDPPSRVVLPRRWAPGLRPGSVHGVPSRCRDPAPGGPDRPCGESRALRVDLRQPVPREGP